MLGAGVNGTENNFGELAPASITGLVYVDANNDGSPAGDTGIPGATVTLMGTDDLGNPVTLTTTTAADGTYSFSNLRPGTYKVTETQPVGYLDGKDSAGTSGGVLTPAPSTMLLKLSLADTPPGVPIVSLPSR